MKGQPEREKLKKHGKNCKCRPIFFIFWVTLIIVVCCGMSKKSFQVVESDQYQYWLYLIHFQFKSLYRNTEIRTFFSQKCSKEGCQGRRKVPFLAQKSPFLTLHPHKSHFWAKTDPTQWDQISPISWG